jgi:hypothetical protein
MTTQGIGLAATGRQAWRQVHVAWSIDTVALPMPDADRKLQIQRPP